MSPDQREKAIKKSAMDIPPYEARPSAPRLEGSEKDSLVKTVIAAKDVPMNYDAVNVFNYTAFDENFDHMLLNFYYTNPTDPTTTILSYRAYTSGNITEA
jgi:hypothetical protein